MGFAERLSKIRQGKNLSFPDLARHTGIHATQLRRYEKGESQPTLDVLRRLSVVLNVPGDLLLFDDEERTPPEDFILQFEALSHLNQEEKRTVRMVIDGIILRHQASKWTNKDNE